MVLRIAGLQTAGTPGDVDAGLAELASATARARAGGAELLITGGSAAVSTVLALIPIPGLLLGLAVGGRLRSGAHAEP